LSSKADSWKALPQQAPPEKFWTDFSKFVLASYNFDRSDNQADHDHYWDTLIKWADVLMKRYNNELVTRVVIGWIDVQSKTAVSQKK